MSKADSQFNLRMPLGLKRKVVAAAKQNRRSATAEINARLESTFSADTSANPELVAMREFVERAQQLLQYFETRASAGKKSED